MRRGMKQAKHRFFSLLLVGLLLCFAIPVTVHAEDGDTPDVFSDLAELQDWLAENPAGGTITLAENIEITEPVRLYLCRVEAQGPLSLPDLVMLDTCIVSPDISGGTVISRKMTKVLPVTSYIYASGEMQAGYLADKNTVCTIRLTAEGVEDESKTVSVIYDDSAVDYDKPGEYLAYGVLQPPDDDFYDFDIFVESCPLAVTVTIYDSGIPYFSSYAIRRGVLVVSYEYGGDFEALTLHRSDDAGESWYVYWQPDDEESDKFQIDHNDYSFDLYFFDPDELAAPFLLVFEVGEGIGSDVLYVDAGSVENMGNGGDRDSGDRILLPWEFFVGNPDEDDEESGGTGGTNPPPNTGDGTDNTDPPPNTEDETGNTNPPPNTEDETGSTNPPVQDNTTNNDSGGDNRRANYSTPAAQPATGLAVMAPLAFSEAVAPTAVNTGTPPDALPAQETALPDTSGEIIASSATANTSVTTPAPAEANPPPGEYEDETTIAISGKRLTALMSVNPQMVPFAREDIQVWIPTDLLSGMSLADSDIFSVIIEKPTQTRVSVLFNMNGQTLDKPFAEPFLVGIPWPETNGEIICTDSSGREIPCEYDRQNSLLILTLYECGTYTIETKPGETGMADNVGSADSTISSNPAVVAPEILSEQPPASSPLLPILAVGTVGVGGAGGLAYAFRKRRVKGI